MTNPNHDQPPRVAVEPSSRGSGRLKAIDRYVGIPLVALAGMRPKRGMPATIQRIGLMKTAAIGDTLLLAGLVDDVRRTYPSGHVVLITGADNRGVVDLLGPTIDERLVVSPRAVGASVRAIRRLHLDILVDFGSWPRFDALLSAASGARTTIGFRTSGQHRHYAYDRVVDHAGTVHERENYARLLNQLGVEAATSPAIAPPKALPSHRRPPDPFVIFHPWSGGYRHEVKEWATERWVALAKALRDRGKQIIITGSKGDANRNAALAAALASANVPVLDGAGQFSLLELADLLLAAEAVIAVNTGVAHLAGLVGARTISLEGPTPIARWAPLGPRVLPVASTYPGSGYLNLGFEYAGQRLDCMAGISVDDVLRAYESLTNR